MSELIITNCRQDLANEPAPGEVTMFLAGREPRPWAPPERPGPAAPWAGSGYGVLPPPNLMQELLGDQRR
jgi:hypothetical protein